MGADTAAGDAAGDDLERDDVSDGEEGEEFSEDELDHHHDALRSTWRVLRRTDGATVRLAAGSDDDDDRLLRIVGHIRLPGVAAPAGSLTLYPACAAARRGRRLAACWRRPMSRPQTSLT